MNARFPLPKFHFDVVWGGVNGKFTEISGLDIENEPIEYRDGPDPEFFKKKIPGMTKYGNITLKRGTFHQDDGLYAWIKTINLTDVEKRDLTISLLNDKHEPAVVWKVKNAWPIKFQSTDLKADSNEIAIETVELAHEGITSIEHV